MTKYEEYANGELPYKITSAEQQMMDITIFKRAQHATTGNKISTVKPHAGGIYTGVIKLISHYIVKTQDGDTQEL